MLTPIIFGLFDWAFVTPIFNAKKQINWIMTIFSFLIGIPGILLSSVFFFNDAFSWTYYPVRLNRKTRKVYVFRGGLPPVEADWDSLLVYCERNTFVDKGGAHFLRAMVLSEDGKTVIDHIRFTSVPLKSEQGVIRFWEFLRRYMEEGPAAVTERVVECVPGNGHRESIVSCTYSMFLNALGSVPNWVVVLLSPFFFIGTLGRIIATYTSRIPKWPAHIEEACTIEPNDPFEKDERINPKWQLPYFGLLDSED